MAIHFQKRRLTRDQECIKENKKDNLATQDVTFDLEEQLLATQDVLAQLLSEGSENNG